MSWHKVSLLLSPIPSLVPHTHLSLKKRGCTTTTLHTQTSLIVSHYTSAVTVSIFKNFGFVFLNPKKLPFGSVSVWFN